MMLHSSWIPQLPQTWILRLAAGLDEHFQLKEHLSSADGTDHSFALLLAGIDKSQIMQPISHLVFFPFRGRHSELIYVFILPSLFLFLHLMSFLAQPMSQVVHGTNTK